ncbi:MAG: FAD-binding oxidoreductase [Clostridiaceae bacterium]|jgi:alkyldihydroxyacetonephosphate synthase|nr:FAD-binding oxidoreductase [Clostridiaceae bacterium]
MAHHPYKDFSPNWYTEKSPEKSYRSIFKWGDPAAYKIPREALYKLLKERCGFDDDYCKERKFVGLDEVDIEIAPSLTAEEIAALKACVGGAATEDTYTRLAVSYGQTMLDLLRLRRKQIEGLTDLVLYPSTTAEVEKIVTFCDTNKIGVYVYGGGSSVTCGVEPKVKRCVTIDTRKNLAKVIKFSKLNQAVTVQPGMTGPNLEKYLNNPDNFEGQAYTLGHFPQSFEYSCVGGWVVTRGAGQNSTFYGKIEDMVLSQTYVTPIGTFTTDSSPRKATGPDINHIMMGSEGAFGILTEVTLYVHKLSAKHKKFSFMFRDFESGTAALREVMQSDNGYPSVFRISDPEETEIAFHLYGVAGTPLETLLKARGYKMGEACLMLGFTDGAPGLQRNIVNAVKRIAHKHGGMSLTGYVTSMWEKGRFSDPYMRDNAQDFGIIIDTLECAVNWENLSAVHKYVRKFVKSRPGTICTTHMSHCYPAGANLYFIWMMKEDNTIEEFKAFHGGILNAIHESGASMSHHHGIGKLFAPYNARSLGEAQMDILRTLKNHFDPNGILNPGGTLGL